MEGYKRSSRIKLVSIDEIISAGQHDGRSVNSNAEILLENYAVNVRRHIWKVVNDHPLQIHR